MTVRSGAVSGLLLVFDQPYFFLKKDLFLELLIVMGMRQIHRLFLERGQSISWPRIQFPKQGHGRTPWPSRGSSTPHTHMQPADPAKGSVTLGVLEGLEGAQKREQEKQAAPYCSG